VNAMSIIYAYVCDTEGVTHSWNEAEIEPALIEDLTNEKIFVFCPHCDCMHVLTGDVRE
jgi:hypothetical protein